MKKRQLLGLLLAATTMTGFAQLSDERSVWEDNTDLKGRVKEVTETNYTIIDGKSNRKGLGGKITIQNETKKSYDRNGLLTEQSLISYVGGDSKRWVFSYDARKKMTEEVVYNNVGLYETIKYIYDGDNLTQKIWYRGSAKTPEKTWYYQYAGNGKLLSEYWTDAGGNIVWKGVYKYDAKGNMIEKSWIVDDRTTSKWTCKYDAAGNIIENAEYVNGILKEISFNTYNEKGQRTEERVLKNDVLDFQKEFAYDKKGNLKFEWWYDTNGKLIHQRNYDYDKSQKMQSSFTWDTGGKLLDKTYWTYDGMGNYVQRIEYAGQIPVYTVKRTIIYY